MPRNILGIWKNSSRIKKLATGTLACTALAALAFMGWHFNRADTPAAPAPQASSAVAAPAPAQTTPPPIMAQQASVASIIEVVVGRNDTLDAIFRRMALNKSDLAAIRNLPGIRQSLDFLKPGDSIKLTHTDGDIKELTRKVSETQTLDVVRQDAVSRRR